MSVCLSPFSVPPFRPVLSMLRGEVVAVARCYFQFAEDVGWVAARLVYVRVASASHMLSVVSCCPAALDAYKQAGSVAEEALANVRTIASLGGEGYMAQAYTNNLKQAQKTAIKGGLLTGAGKRGLHRD